jgi:hypothetical protein
MQTTTEHKLVTVRKDNSIERTWTASCVCGRLFTDATKSEACAALNEHVHNPSDPRLGW